MGFCQLVRSGLALICGRLFGVQGLARFIGVTSQLAVGLGIPHGLVRSYILRSWALLFGGLVRLHCGWGLSRIAWFLRL